ncbi:MDR family MFS transporter [Rothia uropygialis]|uniref:MDR family MFS transporter n=1 Tax=Kocuria sp. 36 TaxID=1415402 RepID=UPI00101BC3C2|nr:MDR family MFS transporter [Kocuria sp. 36]
MSPGPSPASPQTGQFSEVVATEARATPEDQPEALPTKHIVGVLAVLVVSALIMILNETVLTVALPDIMADFEISAATAQWLTTGFLLTMACIIPTTGWMLERFTIKRLFLVALSLFVMGTAMAAFAPNFATILAGRVIQAGGTGIVLPLLMTSTLIMVPPAHRGTVMGLNSVVIAVAPAVGPTLSGIIVNALSWHWVFRMMLPLGVIVLLVGFFLLKPTGHTRKLPLDLASVVLAVLGFGGIVYALGSVSAIAEGRLTPLIGLVIGIIALVLFTSRQRKLQKASGSALLDLRPFAVRNFRLAVSVLMIAMAVMLGSVMVLPILMQSGMGINVMTVGLVMLPGGLLQGLLSPLIGRVYDKFGPRPMVIPGTVMLTAGQWLFFLIHPDTSVGFIVGVHIVFSLGMAMIMTPMMTVALGSLPQNLYSHGSAIMNTLQQLGGATGTAILTAALTVGTGIAVATGSSAGEAQVSGSHAAFFVGGVLGIVALVVAPFIRKITETHRTID